MISLKKVSVVGPGVDAFDARKESDDASPITAAALKRSIDSVSTANFAAIKRLTESINSFEHNQRSYHGLESSKVTPEA